MRHRNDRSAMEQPRQTRFTADEFFVWAAEQESGRFELSGGVVVAMAPERVGHSLAKVDAIFALRAAIRARGLACEALPDGVSIRIDDEPTPLPSRRWGNRRCARLRGIRRASRFCVCSPGSELRRPTRKLKCSRSKQLNSPRIGNAAMSRILSTR